MANPITWSVCLDLDHDYTFDHSKDNITAYVTAANWNNGFASPTADVTAYDDLAPPSRLTLTLLNSGKEFNPETLGSELVTNGNFSTWSGDNPSGWTVTGESGSDPEVEQSSPSKYHGQGGTGACNIYSTSTTVSISQSILTVGTSYQVTLKVTAGRNKPGGLRIYSGTQQVGFLIQETGNYTFYFNASSATFKIESYRFVDLTIDDVSVKATSLYGRLIAPGSLVRVQATYSAVTYTLYIGRVAKQNGITFASLEPGTGGTKGSGASQVTLTVEDGMLPLLDAEYTAPLLTNATVDMAIQRMFDDGVLRWPYGDYGTMLGIQGTNTLGLTARLYGYQTTILDLETGITEASYLGEMSDKGAGVSAQGYLRDTLPIEGGGRLFWNTRTGKETFHNRYHDPLNTTITATYTQDYFIDWRYTYADNLINKVTLNYTTREIGAAFSVVWINKSVPFQLKKGDRRTITARYVDPSNDKVRIGVQTGVPMQAGVDYIGNSDQTGSGNDLSTQLSIGVTFGATSAQIVISNNTTSSIWVTYLQLRATPFLWQTDTYTTSDGYSIAKYGEATSQPKSIRAVADMGFVELLGLDILRRFKNPITVIQSATLNGTEYPSVVLSRVIGDKITLTDTYTSHNADYIIVGETHSVSMAGYNYTVTWVLKPALREAIYLVGVTGRDELDSVNVLGL